MIEVSLMINVVVQSAATDEARHREYKLKTRMPFAPQFGTMISTDDTFPLDVMPAVETVAYELDTGETKIFLEDIDQTTQKDDVEEQTRYVDSEMEKSGFVPVSQWKEGMP